VSIVGVIIVVRPIPARFDLALLVEQSLQKPVFLGVPRRLLLEDREQPV
jgi:hypothetical protein